MSPSNLISQDDSVANVLSNFSTLWILSSFHFKLPELKRDRMEPDVGTYFL